MTETDKAQLEEIKKDLKEFVDAPNTEEGRKGAVDKLNTFFAEFINK